MNVKFAYALGDIRIFTLEDNNNNATFSVLVFIIALEPCNVMHSFKLYEMTFPASVNVLRLQVLLLEYSVWCIEIEV